MHAEASLSNVEPHKLDITCRDHEAAVLARNTLHFTLVADDGAGDRLPNIWNTIYHIMLDESLLSSPNEQCHNLVPLAESLDS